MRDSAGIGVLLAPGTGLPELAMALEAKYEALRGMSAAIHASARVPPFDLTDAAWDRALHDICADMAPGEG